jgi:hypothetical protein
LANGIEYYFAVERGESGNRGHLPAVGCDGDGMFYRYTRLTNLGDGMLRIRHSPDLVAWKSLSEAGLGHTVNSHDNSDGTTTVELRFAPVSGRGFFTFELSGP